MFKGFARRRANQFDQFAPIHLARLPSTAPNRLRQKANFVSGFNLIGISSPGLKIFLSENRNCGTFRASALSREAYRDRHETWGGMWWTRPLTSGAEADGEIVWS